ncbi:MAG: hypothetical protein JWO44_225 [Bacteroidetes bacterium]|nr:hypothetical protein [Bacteroidota bacterium]
MKQKKDAKINRWHKYQLFVRGKDLHADDQLKNISYWRDEVFFRILIYFTPLSIIALIPGVYMAFLKGVPVIGFVDLLAFISLIVIVVNPGLRLQVKKLVFIFIFYMVSVVLIYYMGKMGPGLLFLLAITVISSVIYSSAAGYYSAWANTFICFVFGVLNYFNIKIPVVADFNLGTWIAVTANLILLSFACARCLHLLLEGLERSLYDNKISDEKLKKVSRLYQFISHINQGIVHIKDEQTLFHKSCQIAYEIGRFRMAWIGKFDPDHHRIILMAQKGIHENDLHLFNSSYTTEGPQDHALRNGSCYICNDIETDLELKDRKQFASLHGIRSFIVLPIKKEGIAIGTFNLYAAEPNAFDEEEIRLLQEATDDISFALDVFIKEKKHKEAEELIIHNEKRFRALVENGADAIAILSPSGSIQYVSPSIEKILGFTKEETMKLNLFLLVHPQDLADVTTTWTQMMSSPGIPLPGCISRVRHKDGTWRWLEATITNMLHDPAINGIVDNFRDVTEKKSLEEQQEFDKNNLDALINNTSDLMWSVDRNFNLITSNQPFNSILAMAGRIIKKGTNILAGAFSEKESIRYKFNYERAFEGETFTQLEHGIEPTEYWLEVSFCPIRSGNDIIGCACHSRDITKRKQAEENLRQSESRLNEAQAIAHLGSWEMQFETGAAIWSAETCRIYGLQPDEQTQSHSAWLSFVHPEDLDYVITHTTKSRETHSDTILNHRILLKDGTVKYVYTKSMYEINREGRATGLHGIVLDITEIKLKEEEREKMLTNIVEHSKKLEQFAFIVSHNLRAPVAHILGLSDVLKGDLTEEEKVLSQQFLFKAIEQLDNVFKDLNKILQLKSAINDYKEQVDFKELTDDIKLSNHSLMEKEKVKIVTDFHAINKINSVKSYIYSIFYNLISNSIKYRKPEIPPVIHITSEVQDNSVRIIFKDNGLGINLLKHGENLFGLYKRFHQSSEGKGMGLFMIKTQIEVLGGTIKVKSEEENGMEFTIDLPL